MMVNNTAFNCTEGGVGRAIPIAIGILCTQAPIPLAFLFFKKKKVTRLTLKTCKYFFSCLHTKDTDSITV